MEEDQDEQATVAELKEAFRLYDREGNGYISTEVFREILHELDENLSPEELDMMIEEIDADGSGTLDFDGKIIIIYVRVYVIILVDGSYFLFNHLIILVL